MTSTTTPRVGVVEIEFVTLVHQNRAGHNSYRFVLRMMTRLFTAPFVAGCGYAIVLT